MNPTTKAPALDVLISKLAGKSRELQRAEKLCMLCHGDASKFNDFLSLKEYTISGACQTCQDNIFGSAK